MSVPLSSKWSLLCASNEAVSLAQVVQPSGIMCV